MSESVAELRRQNEALRERVSRLSAAVLRVSASLDLNTVLREVIESARALTGARFGLIVTVDDAGHVEDFVSSGFTGDEVDAMVAWADGPKLLAHFRDLAGPLRLSDLSAYVRALGFSTDLMVSEAMQSVPMRHHDVPVGIFFIAEKECGREFTSDDEEIVTLFASQAATAIANARAHRAEKRARTDLETLIEISPVGVAVFDGAAGTLVSINQEARRIFSELGQPGLALEELQRILTWRRADGREVALADFNMAQLVGRGETVRAEEMTFTVPDGRSVKTLMNATPIRSADGAVERAVVTMQDLSPLEEFDRQRATFLAIVSHELRAPLISIKGSTATVLGASPTPDPTEMLQFFQVIDRQADLMRGLIADLLDHGRIVTGTLSVSPEPIEVAALVDQARSAFESGAGRHTLSIDLPEDLPQVMADRARIVQVLNILVSSAATHSPDSSSIRISAALDGVHVAISVTDKGRGVPPDRLPHLFSRYAAAASGERKSGQAGVGLGLAICKGLVEAQGGRIWADSEGPGRGTRVTFTVPVTEETRAPQGLVRGRSRAATEGQEETRILVVDDDLQMLRYVRDTLTDAGYALVSTGDPGEVADLIRMHKPALVLLDLFLPETDGIELMEQLPELADLPVIFISAYGREETIVRALDAGAADYIVKPFSPAELAARVRAALRRRAGPTPFVLGDLTIQYDQRRVALAGRPVQLTPTEYELLRVLSVNAGRVLTHESLLRQAWGERHRGAAPDPKLVRAVVKRLRRKLGDDAADPDYIRNERGVGYLMPG
ncbi:MAG: response regulator [Gemmatimonadetes bacterium]|nr:response regulator [Gemmatimonadota bacterium]MYB99799.1 response regulator [Gemmatimonadota bacterium]MYI45270.1 response regulator [Gemmatimonadota bacterium]